MESSSASTPQQAKLAQHLASGTGRQALPAFSRRSGHSATPATGFAPTDPAAGVAILKDRVVGFEVHDLHAFDASGRDVPLGTGVGKLQDMFDTLARVKKGPVLLSVEYTSNPENPADDVKQCIQFLDRQAIRLAGSSP